ncbi:MAG: A24 family peptidase [Pararhizobium sp.]
MLEAAIFIVFPLCMAVAAFCDTLSMTIPNRVSVILVAAFIVLAPLSGMAWPLVGLHLLAGVAVFAACFALFAANVMGGGDAKLLTAAAVWFGLGPSLLAFLVTVSMIGGLLTVVLLILRARTEVQAIAARMALPAHLMDRSAGIPYGIAIGIAGFICYPQTELMLLALQRLN